MALVGERQCSSVVVLYASEQPMSVIGCLIAGMQALRGMGTDLRSDCPRFLQLLRADWACWIRLSNGLLNFEKPFNEVKTIWLNQASAEWPKMEWISPEVNVLASALFPALHDILRETLSYHNSYCGAIRETA